MECDTPTGERVDIMAKKREFILTWNAAQKQWRKKYKGKLYYCGSGKAKYDRESYKAAVAFWKQKKTEVDAGIKSDLKPAALKPQPVEADQKPQPVWNPKQTTTCINRFLKAKEADVAMGKIKPGRLLDLKGRLQMFKDFFDVTHIDTIDEDSITRYQQHSVSQMKELNLKVATLGQDYKAVRQFFNWCYDQRIINEKPRNLKELAVKITNGHNHYFTKAELHKLVDGCLVDKDESWKILQACIMLGINMGYTQRDCSDLLVGEVLASKRPPRIIRNRSKTDVPSNHLMWQKTRELLLPFCEGKADSDRVFYRPDGRELVPNSVDSKGNETGGRSDFLGNKFKRLVQDVLKVDDTRRFRALRKTGADHIKQRQPGMESMYLAHNDSKMSAVYTEPAQKQFDRLLSYMEKDLGFTDRLQLK